MDYKKETIKLFKSLQGRHDLWTVYSDFLIIASCALSNSVDRYNFNYREDMYLKTINKYNRDEIDTLIKIYANLTMWLEYKPTDALGEIFMELNLGNKHRGQFFTPYSVCELMASITLNDISKHINSKGYFTLDEPTCGAGANIIAAAMRVKELGYNYQKVMYVNATDIDLRAVQMCYIQLSLLGIPAIVNNHNTLAPSLPDRKDQWITPLYALNTGMLNIGEKEKKVG